MKQKSIYVLVLLVLCSQLLLAQEKTLLLSKPGTFKIVDWGVYTHYDCGFTKTETTENYRKLTGLTEVVRRNPVMSTLRGIDCQAVLYINSCEPKDGYGIPCKVSFEFSSWSEENGKEQKWEIEPPSWGIYVNSLKTFSSGGFNFTCNIPTDPRGGFNMEQWEKAAEKANELFFMPGLKENLAAGVDRYNGENIVSYNPDRPPYWKPVTIREVFNLLFQYWELDPNQQSSDMMMKALKDEYERFSETERNGYAFNGDPGSISGIGKDDTGIPVMRVNPDYWDKRLPKSAIQILSFYCPADKELIKSEREERLTNQDGSYHVSRFLEELNILDFQGIVAR